jgi:hypothetical protein
MKTNLYFDTTHLPIPRGEYVAWCDCMGTGRCLVRSLHRAASSVFKLHAAFSIAQEQSDGIRCYPVMDGVYVASPTRETMRSALCRAFCELAKEFIGSRGTGRMHMIRAGLAYGPTLHGPDIDQEAFIGTTRTGRTISREEFESSPLNRTRHQVLLSPAMVSAYQAEKLAPPFGIYIHDSAKGYPQLADSKDPGFNTNLLQWWKGDEEGEVVLPLLYEQVLFYLEKAETHSVGMGYPRESIERHRNLAIEYLGGVAAESEGGS